MNTLKHCLTFTIVMALSWRRGLPEFPTTVLSQYYHSRLPNNIANSDQGRYLVVMIRKLDSADTSDPLNSEDYRLDKQ